LDPGTNNYFKIDSTQQWTHLRLQIYPDGGVARLRVYGKPKGLVYDKSKANELVDLVSVVNGGRGLCCSNQYFSSMNNLLLPGKAINMGYKILLLIIDCVLVMDGKRREEEVQDSIGLLSRWDVK
jgi:allantoicase